MKCTITTIKNRYSSIKQQNVITESKVKVAILQRKRERNIYIIDFHRLFILMDQCVISI